MLRWILLIGLLVAPAWSAPSYTYHALGLQFQCGLDLVTAKSYRPHIADYMWPSMSGPQLNLVLHLAAPGATLEEELQNAFGETLIPTSTKAPKGWSLARGPGFRGAFVHSSRGRLFIGARTRSQPPLSDAQLDRIILDIVRSQYP